MSFRSVRKKIKNWLIYTVVRFFVNYLRFIGRAQALKIMSVMGNGAYYIAKNERRKTIQHLSLAFGNELDQDEIDQMAKQVFINAGRNATDAIRLPVAIREGLDTIVKVKGLENMQRALMRGKGVVALTGHLGNWELLGCWLAQKGYPLNVVGTPVYDARLDEMIVAARNSAGYRNIARGKATREIIRALRRSEMVGILMDQDTRVEGVFVDFFGRKAHTPTGPVILARKVGAAVVPIFIHLRDDHTHVIECLEEIKLVRTEDEEQDIIINTQKCNEVYESIIRKYPTQWVWMHERWKKNPQTTIS